MKEPSDTDLWPANLDPEDIFRESSQVCALVIRTIVHADAHDFVGLVTCQLCSLSEEYIQHTSLNTSERLRPPGFRERLNEPSLAILSSLECGPGMMEMSVPTKSSRRQVIWVA